MAVASADVSSGKAPLIINFDSSSSADSDGTISHYLLDFMDGNFSTEANPSYEFTIPDTYRVTLTVTDDQGLEVSNSIDITVRKGKKR